MATEIEKIVYGLGPKLDAVTDRLDSFIDFFKETLTESRDWRKDHDLGANAQAEAIAAFKPQLEKFAPILKRLDSIEDASAENSAVTVRMVDRLDRMDGDLSRMGGHIDTLMDRTTPTEELEPDRRKTPRKLLTPKRLKVTGGSLIVLAVPAVTWWNQLSEFFTWMRRWNS